MNVQGRIPRRHRSASWAQVHEGLIQNVRLTHACFPQAHFCDERAGAPGQARSGDHRRVGQARFEQDPRIVEQATGEVHLLSLTGAQGAHALLAFVADWTPRQQLITDLRAVGGRAYLRVTGMIREKSWLFFEILLPFLSTSAFVFV